MPSIGYLRFYLLHLYYKYVYDELLNDRQQVS